MASVFQVRANTPTPALLRRLLPHLVTFVLYLVLTTWATRFMLDSPPVPLLWPATGIGLAMMYRFGYSIAWTLVLAGALAHFLFGAEPLQSVILAMGAALGALLGVCLLKRLDFEPALKRSRDIIILLTAGGLVSAFVSGLTGTLAMVGIRSGFAETLGLCWLADTMGVILFAPALMALHARVANPYETLRTGGLIAMVPAVTYLVYAGGLPDHVALPMSYVSFPLVLFLAFRLSPAGVALATLLGAMVAVGCTVLGKGPFAQADDMRPDLVSLFVQLAILQLTALLLVAIRHERFEAERRARAHLRTLARVGRMNAMSTMAAGIAHEMNQPLCAANSYAQAAVRMIERRTEPALLAEPLRRIVESTQRAADIVRRTRHFLETGDQERGDCDVVEVVREAVALMRPEYQRHDIRLTVDFSADRPVIQADQLEIQQVLVNLLQNAIEAIERGPRGAPRWVSVAVHAVKGRRQITIVVTDSGPGLPDGDKDQLFDPLVSYRDGGNGLGLAIARSIIEAHGGSVSAENAASGGAEFRLVLPIESSRE